MFAVMLDGVMVGAAADEEDFTTVMLENETRLYGDEHPEVESDDACYQAVIDRVNARVSLYKLERIG